MCCAFVPLGFLSQSKLLKAGLYTVYVQDRRPLGRLGPYQAPSPYGLQTLKLKPQTPGLFPLTPKEAQLPPLSPVTRDRV